MEISTLGRQASLCWEISWMARESAYLELFEDHCVALAVQLFVNDPVRLGGSCACNYLASPGLGDSQGQASRIAQTKSVHGHKPPGKRQPCLSRTTHEYSETLQLLRFRSSSRFQFLWHEQIYVKIAFIWKYLTTCYYKLMLLLLYKSLNIKPFHFIQCN